MRLKALVDVVNERQANATPVALTISFEGCIMGRLYLCLYLYLFRPSVCVTVWGNGNVLEERGFFSCVFGSLIEERTLGLLVCVCVCVCVCPQAL